MVAQARLTLQENQHIIAQYYGLTLHLGSCVSTKVHKVYDMDCEVLEDEKLNQIQTK
jgi:hypothetical protein